MRVRQIREPTAADVAAQPYADAITRAAAVVNGRPDPLVPARKVKGDVPAGVSAALTRALALNIENRPRNVSEMRRELRDATPRAADTVPMEDAREFPVEDADEVTRVASSSQGSRRIRISRRWSRSTWTRGWRRSGA